MPRTIIMCFFCDKRIRDENKKRIVGGNICCVNCFLREVKQISSYCKEHSDNNDQNSDVQNNSEIESLSEEQDPIIGHENATASTSRELDELLSQQNSSHEIENFEPDIKKVKLSYKRFTKFTKR